MKFTDERNKEVGNFVNGIKSVKYNAWENIIFNGINKIRIFEKGFNFKILGIQVYDNLFSFINPILATFLSLSIKKLNNDDISLGDIYFILMLYNMFVLPIRIFFYSVLMYLDTKIIFNRINHIIDFEDEESLDENNNDLPLGEILIENASCFYDDEIIKKKVDEFENSLLINKGKKQDKKEVLKIMPILENINLSLKGGEFLAIVGKVGSGKTSLLKAIQKNLFIKKGKISKNGQIAYIPQTSFLMNETIKQNIVFGKKYEKKKLDKILKICELQDDLDILPGGLETEIGERGINLSGGQKQRINIARAIYSNSDIYLIDDSLSALDSLVGQNIFKNVFKNFLEGKSKILVTHSLQYLDEVDRVIFIDDGKIIANGVYKKLIDENEKFRNFCNDLKKKDKENDKNNTIMSISESFSKIEKKKKN